MTKYHCFKFDSEHPGILFAMELCFTDMEYTLFILCPSLNVEDVRRLATQASVISVYNDVFNQLKLAKSVQQATRYG